MKINGKAWKVNEKHGNQRKGMQINEKHESQ